MTPDAVAAALIAGQTPDVADLIAYWRATDLGQRPKAETIAVLAALAATPPEAPRIAAFLSYVDESQPPIHFAGLENAVNLVGTGGGLSTFNISTTAAFVVAAAGGKVLKSGSRAYSGQVGAADLLAALRLDGVTDLAALEEMLGTLGMAFAPGSAYAPICRRLAMASLPLPFKVIGRFVNGLGPLICPFAVGGSLVGTASRESFDLIRAMATETGRRVLAVHCELGVDELLSIAPNLIGWSGADAPPLSRIDPSELGLAPGGITSLKGGDLAANIALLEEILAGRAPRVHLETVALNAGAALHVAGLARDPASGMALALDCLRDGAPLAQLHRAQDFVAKAISHRRVAP